MVIRWRFIRAYLGGIAVICLFLAAGSSDSLAQSSLPFRLSTWGGNLKASSCQTTCHQDLPTQSSDGEAISEEHAQISVQHGGLGCLDCHAPENRDILRAVGHRRVDFSNMEEICEGCHSAEYLDWKKGIHGKLFGSWNGIQGGLRCVECHDIHRPKPMTLKPESAPCPRK
jgi:hypothetical protein